METYGRLGEAAKSYSLGGPIKSSYSGFSLAAKDVDWIQGYRTALKSPVYNR